MLRVEGIGCVMRECSEEVRLGISRFWSGPWSRVLGLPSRSLVRGRVKEEWVFNEGGIMAVVKRIGPSYLSSNWVSE
jgi:hypothetical protein